MREHVRNVERAILGAVAHDAAIDAHAQLFLLRLARLDGREDLIETVGESLARALVDYPMAASPADRASWLALFLEAQRFSDDLRLPAAVGRLMSRLRDDWTATPIAAAAAALGATLVVAALPSYQEFAAPAIDELERIVSTHYVPGEEMGSFADQVQAASALLAAYELTGRLPYPMLAEELMQTARRHPSPGFEEACEAARVWCRLAVLHADADYRAAAVLAPSVDYRGDAVRLLTNLSADACQRGAAGGIYGLALLELESASLLP